MIRKTALPLAAAAALLLLAAPAARAEHRYDREAQVRGLAHDLVYATDELWRAARYQRHHYDRSERAALDALYDLHERAEHFYRQVRRGHPLDRHSLHDFHKLERSWERVAYRGVRALHPYRDVDYRLRRVAALMSDLHLALDPGPGAFYRGEPIRPGLHFRPHFRFDFRWWR